MINVSFRAQSERYRGDLICLKPRTWSQRWNLNKNHTPTELNEINSISTKYLSECLFIAMIFRTKSIVTLNI